MRRRGWGPPVPLSHSQESEWLTWIGKFVLYLWQPTFIVTLCWFPSFKNGFECALVPLEWPSWWGRYSRDRSTQHEFGRPLFYRCWTFYKAWSGLIACWSRYVKSLTGKPRLTHTALVHRVASVLGDQQKQPPQKSYRASQTSASKKTMRLLFQLKDCEAA